MVFEFAVILFVVLFFGLLFAKLKLPLMASYIFSGLIVSLLYRLLHFNMQFLSQAADIGVILLLFTVGVESSISNLKNKMRMFLLKVTFWQILFVAFCFLPLLFLSKFTLGASFIFAILLSFSSTVVAIKFLINRGEAQTLVGEYAVLMLIIQDFLVLPLSIMAPVLLHWQDFSLSMIWSILFGFLRALFIFILVFFIARRVFPAILRRVSKFLENELLLLSIFAMGFIFSGFAEKIGFSLAIGAFLSGVIISMTAEKHEVFSEIRPIRDVFSIIFFVFLGMSIDPTFLIFNFFLVFLYALILIILKTAVLFALLIVFKTFRKNALKIASLFAAVSEFAFILAQVFYKQNLISQYEFNFVIALVFLTIFLSPFVLRIATYMLKNLPFFSLSDKERSEYLEPAKLTRHVVLCGFGRIGKQILKQMMLHGISCVVIDHNIFEVRRLQELGHVAIYGDPVEIEILNFANLKEARILVIAIPDRFSSEIIMQHAYRLNPQIKIFARVHHAEDKKYLYAMGANYVSFPEFEGALAIAKKILLSFGIDETLIIKTLENSRYEEKII